MTNGWEVTAQNITNWSENNRRQAQDTLPLLVKKLILASSKPENLSFPSGDSVLVGGWDGFLKVENGNVYIPKGTSVWEFGTTGSVGTKANGDYNKRTADPLGIEKSDTTFVFVTTRVWRNRDEWVSQKQQQGHWKQIVGLNADDLATWLELCPAVHRWFARLIGQRPQGAWDIDQAWLNWSCTTEIKITPKLVIAGRSENRQKIIDILEERPSVIRISSDSRDESYAFALATIKEDERLSSRFVAVLEPNAWDILVENDSPLILLPYFQETRTYAAAITQGHWVVLPEPGTRSSGTKIVVPLNKADRNSQMEALVDMGLNEELVVKVIESCRGNLKAIRRHEALVPLEIQTPPWSLREELIQPALAILLAGSWRADNTMDCNKLSELAGLPYSEFEQYCNSLALIDDPPIRRIGNVWICLSRQDTWSFLAKHINEAVVDRFSQVTKDVLSEMDSRYGNLSEDTWHVNIDGKRLQFSEELRTGLAEMINLLAVFGDADCRNIGPNTIQDRMSYLVRQMLIEETADARWYSLRQVLPLLAESAPTVFLEAIESDLRTDTPTIRGMFKEGFMIGASQSNLLWALEIVSWNLECLARTARVLAKLDVLDPGGNYTNRPINSLREIFLGWHPQTKASLDIRLQVIDVLIRQEPQTAWKLLLLLLPSHGEISYPISRPKQRQWDAGWIKGVSLAENDRHAEEITKRVLECATHNLNARWKQVIEKIPNLPPQCIEMIVSENEKLQPTSFSPKAQLEISEKLRDMISRHRQFSATEWALSEPILVRLQNIHERFASSDMVSSYAYLFDEHYPPLLNPEPEWDYEKSKRKVEELRIQALEMIWTSEGWEGIKRLVTETSLPYVVGSVLAKTTFSDEVEDQVLEQLSLTEDKLVQFSHSFSAHKSNTLDGWVSKIRLSRKDNWNNEKWVAFSLTLQFGSQVFNLLEELGEEISKEYWSRVSNFYLSEKDAEHVEWIIKRLLDCNRPLAAVDAMHRFLRRIDTKSSLSSELIAYVLEMVVTDKGTSENKAYFSHIGYEITELFKFLQASGDLSDERMARLEWLYLALFEHRDIMPKTLLRDVLNEPALFIQLIKTFYPSKPEIQNEYEGIAPETLKQMAKSAHMLLKMIITLPGQNDNEIDSGMLKDWIKQVRRMAYECNRSKVVDIKIGEILSHSPSGSDGIWPHEGVRGIFEYLENDVIERGFIVALFNQRGFTSRSIGEGGKQERNLASNYDSQAIELQFTWPRTASILKQISQGYVRDAVWEDTEAELRYFF
ncbi:hypothetical protein EYB33_15135 [Lysinibacillus sphaericus]|uniref:hypothetical protein n=1 Tax=Lysinibacillus sphaericus TaxID=1421 RepID=UPI001E405484|nr:hypothetical protein [Lysinibacillus sphaericus]UDK97558.1 hypothetical protein EYB33_15135 [Lysinibacillus sphaericus]